MAQYYPVVVQAGTNLAGDSLGFHAYSLRVDNCTNQWYLEETSLAYIPPYSLGVCLRLYGTGVAILLNSAPIGQPQLAPIVGEQIVGVYSDQLRTEVAPSPIRQFTLVQSVSDLLQGAQPATPPVGTTRLWAANNGDVHYLLSSGTDALLLSTTNYAAYVGSSSVGGDLSGTVSNAIVEERVSSYVYGLDTHGTNARMLGHAGTDSVYLFTGTNGYLYFYSDYPGTDLGLWQAGASGGTLSVYGALAVGQSVVVGTTLSVTNGVSAATASISGNASVGGYLTIGPAAVAQPGDIGAARTGNPVTGILYLGNSGARYVYFDGTYYQMPNGIIQTGGIYSTGPIRGTNTGYLGQYVNPVVFSSTVYNAWVATPIAVSFTIPSGHSGSVLITYSVMVTSAVIGTIMYASPAMDGSVSEYQVNHVFQANYYQIMSGSIVVTGLSLGAHTLTLYIQSNSGVWSIWNAGHNIMTVTGLVS